jgi:metal-sulfur cluster biosynthetic enzyme
LIGRLVDLRQPRRNGPDRQGAGNGGSNRLEAVLDALRSVVDPEIGMNVVELALIRQVILGDDESEIKMILTTPFCPYAGSMIQQVKELNLCE